MRSVARHHDEGPPPEPREDPRVRAAELDAAYEAVLNRLAAGERTDDLMFELISAARQYADHTAALEKLLAVQYARDREFAAGVAFGERRAAARQKVPGPRHASGRTWLNVVKALVPAAGLGLAARVWSAHRVVTASLAASAATAVTVAGMQPARTLPDYAAAPRPPAWQQAAVPIPPVSPGAYITQPKPAAVRVRPLVTAPPPTPAPSPSASVSTASGPAVQDSPPPAQAAGTLQADVPSLNLGVLYTGQVTITASGGTVQWGATAGSGGMTLDVTRGTLGDGQSAVIGVSVSAAARLAGGSGTLRIWPGITVTVTWDALPQVPDLPAQDPSAS